MGMAHSLIWKAARIWHPSESHCPVADNAMVPRSDPQQMDGAHSGRPTANYDQQPLDDQEPTLAVELVSGIGVSVRQPLQQLKKLPASVSVV